MRHDKVIYLLTTTITEDAIGNQIEQEVPRMVFANEFEVSSSEFYEASLQGLKAEKRFELYSFEYEDETKLMYNNEEYKVIRTQSKGEKVRITCQKV
ncbi:hypothetical protein [Metabacillus halosaccharovorans]|uniref:hypothetical protein n=1 Tax=Metabacillus halosaccharovorans TaxID=930124 RepID=UPI00203B0526|nr:hypothetical protein [Metabacillus halosaccharovorans]MCM3444378.1 hypothetical protein [Metabacillus halosaccharovorans]